MDKDLYQRLLDASFRFVSYRSRSEKEIDDFLQKTLKRWKTAGKTTAGKVHSRLRDLGYVDDVKFASQFIEQRNHFKPKGEKLLRFELLRKGVNRSVIDECLHAQMQDPVTQEIQYSSPHEREVINARNAVKKRVILWQKLPITARKKKVYDFLFRRGFSSGVIYTIIDETTPNNYNTGT